MARHMDEENAVVRSRIAEAQAGSGEALEKLLTMFLPLRKALATYWRGKTPNHSKGVEWDDLVQQIDLLFVEIVHRFREEGADPILFISVSLRQDVARWCVQEGFGRMREVGGDEIAELIDAPVEADEPRSLLLVGLSPGQQRVITALAQAGTQEAAASLLGVTNQAVSKRLKVIRKKLNVDGG